MTLKALLLNFRLLAPSLGVIIGVILLSLFSFRFAWGRITQIQSATAVVQKEERALREKLDILEDLSSSGITSQVTSATTALPANNSGLMTLAQLKSLALLQGITLGNIKMGNPVSGSLSSVEIALDADGSFPAVVGYIKSLSRAAPLMGLDELQIVSSGGEARASLAILTYWAPYPAKIPPLTEPITDLTADERKYLEELRVLTAPPFTADIKPSSPVDRSNPFSL